jgi:undecaprenyl diphosphate synthase
MIKHLGIIIDGNRRWAKEKSLKPWKGHEKGAEAVDKLLDNCLELGIKEITIYTLSTENLKRDALELEFLFKLFKSWFSRIKKDPRINENKVKIRFIGDLSLVPKDVRELAESIEKDTSGNDNYTINFLFAYGGRLELVKAVNRLIKSGKKEITEEDITDNLWLRDEPELVIRTGGCERLSNFLPWQSTYSELIFLKKMWPDFDKEDLLSCIKEFESRKRNFGK